MFKKLFQKKPKCEYKNCCNLQLEGYLTCPKHCRTCDHNGCKTYVTRFLYCDYHKCQNKNCLSEKLFEFKHCNNCLCLTTGCPLCKTNVHETDNRGYCCEHVCKNKNCFEGASTCESQYRTYRYCQKCVCGIDDCNNCKIPKEKDRENGGCEKHYIWCGQKIHSVGYYHNSRFDCGQRGCSNPRLGNNSFCAEHKCKIDGCYNREHIWYCKHHSCVSYMCQQSTIDNTKACKDHLCVQCKREGFETDHGPYCYSCSDNLKTMITNIASMKVY